jgi:hypothetical protein
MVPISPQAYSAEAVVFDTRPLAALQQKLAAKREAKRAAEDDAINKYLTDQAGKLTPTGVRAIDLPGFEKRRKDWMQFSILNKDKIKKDPLTRMEADRLYNDALAWQQQSKDATGERTPAIDLIRNPNTRNQLNFERVAGDITLHDLALDDPNRKKIDYNASWYKAPSFDFNKEFKVAAEGQQKAFLRKIPGTLDTQLGTIQTEEGFLPESIKQIARNFARSVIEDPNKLDYYERKSKSASADELIKLNAILKPYFPKLEVALDQPEALAMAEAIERAQSIKDVVPREDKAYSSRLISSRQQGPSDKTIKDYDLLNKYDKEKGQVIDLVSEGVTREERIAKPTRVVLAKDVPSQDYQLITDKENVSPYTSGKMQYFIVREDGNWEGAGGKVIDSYVVARANLDKTSLSEERRLQQGIITPKKKKGELD